MSSDEISKWILRKRAQDSIPELIHLPGRGLFQHLPVHRVESVDRMEDLFLVRLEIQPGQDIVVPLTLDAMKQLVQSVETWKKKLRNDLERAETDQKPS